MSTGAPLAVFGGTFDPVHNGHLLLARQVLAGGHASQVVFLPAAVPPHKARRPISPARHRLAMLERALADQPQCTVSDYELQRPPPSYTIDTADHFNALYGDHWRWLIGSDSLQDLHHWYRARDLVQRCRFLVYRRPGCEPPNADALGRQFGPEIGAQLAASLIPGPTSEVSATEIRRRVAAGEPLGDLTPPPVAEYIRTARLYRGAPPPA